MKKFKNSRCMSNTKSERKISLFSLVTSITNVGFINRNTRINVFQNIQSFIIKMFKMMMS